MKDYSFGTACFLQQLCFYNPLGKWKIKADFLSRSVENSGNRAAVRASLGILLWKYQGGKCFDRGSLLFTGRLLHSLIGTSDYWKADIGKRTLVQSGDCMRYRFNLPVRHPLSDRNYHRCDIFGTGSSFHHYKQESGSTACFQHDVVLRNDWRFLRTDLSATVLSAFLSGGNDPTGNDQFPLPVVAFAGLHNRAVPLTDTSIETGIRIHRESELQPGTGLQYYPSYAFFGEAKELNLAFYAGLGLILLSVLLQTREATRCKGA